MLAIKIIESAGFFIQFNMDVADFSAVFCDTAERLQGTQFVRVYILLVERSQHDTVIYRQFVY